MVFGTSTLGGSAFHDQINHPYAGIAGQTQSQAQSSVTPPRTLTSAMSQMDNLNERLNEIRAQLCSLSDTIGGPRPLATIAGNNAATPPETSVVGRLNDSAIAAHRQVDEISGLLASIGRALG